MIEGVLIGQSIEFNKEVGRWLGPSYNWAFGNFRQVYHIPQEDLRIYIESRDPQGTREGGHPTDLSIGPVTADARIFIDRLTNLLDEAFSE